jgi:hypothetical protein
MEEMLYAPTKTTAAIMARRRGCSAFETRRVKRDPDCWLFESRTRGPGIEYAELYASDKDFVHHVEITELAVPILVVTCRLDELPDDIPPLFKIEPVTPSLFDKERESRPKAPKLGPAARTRNEPAQLVQNVDPDELARALLILDALNTPVAPPVEKASVSGGLTPEELAAKLFS